MNFQSIKQLDFEVLPRSAGNRKRGKMTIAIRESRIDLSKDLYQALGNPVRVDIGTNGGAFIGVRSIIGSELDVSNSNKSGGAVYGKKYSEKIVGNIDAFRTIDLGSDYIVISDPTQDGDWYVFDADKAVINKRQSRQIKG